MNALHRPVWGAETPAAGPPATGRGVASAALVPEGLPPGRVECLAHAEAAFSRSPGAQLF